VPENESSLEWDLVLVDSVTTIVAIAHGDHLAYNLKGSGFTISIGLAKNHMVCSTCYQQIPSYVLDRRRKLEILMRHGQ